MSGRMRLGIDVGGTFTDLVALDDLDGTLLSEKTLTTPSDPWLAIRSGIQSLQTRGLNLANVVSVVHGTTLASNTLIERTGPRLGLICTAGFRDIVQFGREFRYDVYDPDATIPDPLVPRRFRMEVHERVTAKGAVSMPIDLDEVAAVVRQLLEQSVEAFAVCLMHSYRFADHELAAERVIRAIAPNCTISLSHQVLAQIREFERCSATTINAYLQPLMRGYLRRLRIGLHQLGCRAELYLMTSSGGTMTCETAENFPIHLVESGPAAGSLMAALIGKSIGLPNLMSFDMGGTTAKACVIRRGKPQITKTFEVARARRAKRGSGLPLGIPVIDLLEIGAGGGSIAEVDQLGLLRVGPRSAGAVPGPACYGLGGTEPTVTDANLVLGILGADTFLGGTLTLDRAAAARAIEQRVAQPLGLALEDAALGIVRVVTEEMAAAARVHSVELNVDVRGFGMVAFGGAGPMHAYGVAKRLGLSQVICPGQAGVLSSWGLLSAPLAFEFARSLDARLDELDPQQVNQLLSELESAARDLLRSAGVEAPRLERSVDMSYVGQHYEVTTSIPAGVLSAGGTGLLKALFDESYEKAYGRRLGALNARCVTWRVVAIGPEPLTLVKPLESSPTPELEPTSFRSVIFPDSVVARCPIFKPSGAGRLVGPAIIEQSTATVVVPPGASALIDPQNNVVFWLNASPRALAPDDGTARGIPSESW